MKTKLYTAILFLLLTLFTACDDKGSKPEVYDEFTEWIEEDTPVDPCEDNNESNNSFITTEYCINSHLGLLGASSAYVDGYTGDGVRVAVVDSGVNFNSPDLKANASTDSKSLFAFRYDEDSEDHFTYDENGSRFDQIERIIVEYGGKDYTSAPTITITGDGSGAEAIATIKDGKVINILMDKRGSGYTTATIEIDNNGTGGSGLIIEKYILGGYDNNGHGTAVASIIASVKNQESKEDEYESGLSHGIAFNAEIVSIRVLSDLGMGSGSALTRGISYSEEKDVDIVNLSVGGKHWSEDSYDIFSELINDNTVIVTAAGNSGDACTSLDADDNDSCEFPAAYPWTEDHESLLDGAGGWIVVGAVNEFGELRYYSNKAGITKDNFLVANIDGIRVPFEKESVAESYGRDYTWFSGTSASAPVVSGAVALLREKYPDMDGKEIAQILFDSATDLGEEGVDEIYGHGMVNIKAAFELAESRE